MLLDQIDRGPHAIDAGDIQHAWFVTASPLLELDGPLGQEVGRFDVPGAEQRGAAGLEVLLRDIDNTSGQRTEEPFVSISGEEIDLAGRGREGTERLDGIEGEENAALAQEGADRRDVDPPAGLEMTGGKRHQTSGRT